MLPTRWRRARVPLLVFAVCAALYVATLGPRVRVPSDDGHFVYLADSLLHGSLALRAERPPGNNDWAFYQGRWFVVFPPFPALLVLPFVAIFGTALWDRLFWAITAGAGPALLYVLLRALRERGLSERIVRDDLALTALFGFGSAYYYTAVQGTVWFAAHVVACALIALYVLWSLEARRPVLAGCTLGLLLLTRGPTLLLLGVFFVMQALVAARTAPSAAVARPSDVWRGVDLRRVSASCMRFGVPLACLIALSLWMNAARFDDPFEFGYRFLQIRWRPRIETWGLFNYHYLARNLAVMLTSLPWLSAVPPYITIGRHGLALWVTTPQLLLTLWPRRGGVLLASLGFAAAAVAFADLLYQNSGWIQFGYRFSLDYAVLLFALLALGGRRFGAVFYGLIAVAFAINLFGAITFDRMPRFYDTDATQQRIFQPD